MKKVYNELSYGELLQKRDELEKKHFELRVSKVQGRLENPLLLRTLRRQIASLNTIIHEYGLGIRDPEAAEKA